MVGCSQPRRAGATSKRGSSSPVGRLREGSGRAPGRCHVQQRQRLTASSGAEEAPHRPTHPICRSDRACTEADRGFVRVGGGGAHPRATNDAPFACGAAAPRPRCARPPRRARRAIRAPLRARPAGRLREGSGRLPPAEPSAPPSSSSHTSRTPRTYRKVPRRFREGSSSPHEPRRRAPPPASPRRPAGRRSPWRRVGGGAWQG